MIEKVVKTCDVTGKGLSNGGVLFMYNINIKIIYIEEVRHLKDIAIALSDNKRKKESNINWEERVREDKRFRCYSRSVELFI